MAKLEQRGDSVVIIDNRDNEVLAVDSNGKLTFREVAPTAVADLVNANGVSDGTIADVGAAFAQATLNNNFRDLSDKVNQITAALRQFGLIS